MRTMIFALVMAFGIQATAQEISSDNAPPTTAEAPADAPAAIPAPAPTPATPPVSKIPPPVVTKKETKLGQVSQIFRDKKRVIMTIEPSIADAEVPPQVVVQLPAGEACEGRVLQAQAGKALIDFAECSSFEKVKMSAAITPPLFAPSGPATEAILLPKAAPTQPAPNEKTEEPASQERGRPKITVGLGHHAGSELRFSEVTFSSGATTDKGTYSFSTDSAIQLTAGAILSEPNSWGFFAGVTFEQKRDLRSATATLESGGTSTSYYVGDKPSIQFTLLEVNAIYRWNSFYIPFGLNYSLVKFTQGAGATGVVDANGAMGAQLGVGFYATEQFRVELLSQVNGAKMTITTPTVSADLGNGTLAGMVLRMGVDF